MYAQRQQNVACDGRCWAVLRAYFPPPFKEQRPAIIRRASLAPHQHRHSLHSSAAVFLNRRFLGGFSALGDSVLQPILDFRLQPADCSLAQRYRLGEPPLRYLQIYRTAGKPCAYFDYRKTEDCIGHVRPFRVVVEHGSHWTTGRKEIRPYITS